jgi:uncharacterized membrane protein
VLNFLQRTGGQLAWLVLSLIGVAISIYLITVHYQSAPLICSTTDIVNCESVLSSRYSVVPGTNLPVAVPGLFWYIISIALAIAAWRFWPQRRWLHITELVWASLGMLSVFYFVYVEIVLLDKICTWCTVVHLIILIMFLISVVQLQGTAADAALDPDSFTPI